jgi:DNA-binding transcriptional ArsR family regulator
METHDVSLCFETLANELRVQILKILHEKPMNVTGLTEKLSVERTRVSHSLQMLRDCKLVTVTKQGKEHIYAINNTSPFFSAEQKGGLFALMQEHKQKSCGNCYKVQAPCC